MASALRGYDPVYSDPPKPYPEWDPGFKGVIFEATYQESEFNDQRVYVHPFVQWYPDDEDCQDVLSSKRVQSFEEYDLNRLKSFEFYHSDSHDDEQIMPFYKRKSSSAGYNFKEGRLRLKQRYYEQCPVCLNLIQNKNE